MTELVTYIFKDVCNDNIKAFVSQGCIEKGSSSTGYSFLAEDELIPDMDCNCDANQNVAGESDNSDYPTNTDDAPDSKDDEPEVTSGSKHYSKLTTTMIAIFAVYVSGAWY